MSTRAVGKSLIFFQDKWRSEGGGMGVGDREEEANGRVASHFDLWLTALFLKPINCFRVWQGGGNQGNLDEFSICA